MEIEFSEAVLDRIETDAAFTGGYPPGIVKAYRKRIQAIRAAIDERDLYAIKGNRFEKLQGARSHQHSMRLNDQVRLIVEIKPSTPKNIIIVVGIEDYH
jgi:toxin HigB-1